MDQSGRLLVTLALALSPILLYAALSWARTRSRDDAGWSFGRATASSGVSDAAAKMLDTGPIRSDRTRRADSVACGDCGTSNAGDAAYCRSCLRALRK